MMKKISLRPFLRFLAGTAAIIGGEAEGGVAEGGEKLGVVSIDINSAEKWTIAGQLYHGN
jgi:hypothetical protein